MRDRCPTAWYPRSIRTLCTAFVVLAAGAAFASPASAAVSFTVTPTTVAEGKSVTVTVTRPDGPNAGTPLDVTVQAKTGMATAGDDFDGSAHVLHFNASELSKKTTIATVQDTVD